MFDFLFEGSLTLYILLLLVAGVLYYFWQQKGDRRYLRAILVVALLALLLLLLDWLRETDREGAIRTLREVTNLINKNEHTNAFTYLADDFKYQGMDRKAMEQLWETTLKRFEVSNIQTRSLTVEKQDRDKHTVTLRFIASFDSPYAGGWNSAHCEVDLVRDSQGNWRVKTFRIYHPVNTAEEFNPFGR